MVNTPATMSGTRELVCTFSSTTEALLRDESAALSFRPRSAKTIVERLGRAYGDQTFKLPRRLWTQGAAEI